MSSNVTPGEENYVDDGLEVVEDSGKVVPSEVEGCSTDPLEPFLAKKFSDLKIL